MKYSASSVWENKDEYDVVVVGAGHAKFVRLHLRLQDLDLRQ